MSSNNFKNKKGGFYHKWKHQDDDGTKPGTKNPNEWKFAPLVEGHPQKTCEAIKHFLGGMKLLKVTGKCWPLLQSSCKAIERFKNSKAN